MHVVGVFFFFNQDCANLDKCLKIEKQRIFFVCTGSNVAQSDSGGASESFLV